MLVFVLLEFTVVVVIFKYQSLSQLVTALDSVNPLVHTSLQVGCVRVDDVKLLEEVKVAHVDYVAGHLTEANISDLATSVEERQLLPYFLTVQELLEELVCAYCVEHLVVPKLSQVKVLIEIDAPISIRFVRLEKVVRLLTI